MKRMDYETLSMEEIVVEMEDGFLEASVVNTTVKQSNVETTGHELNEIDLDGKDWNNSTWE